MVDPFSSFPPSIRSSQPVQRMRRRSSRGPLPDTSPCQPQYFTPDKPTKAMLSVNIYGNALSMFMASRPESVLSEGSNCGRSG
ncbi:hypothetical protein E2C01_064233 [Portunus trituberculatus]|uniref:Uncharacterized protein n=1 Tax=Portunus trituberculatus TaxID=210409 RepID=A0A5B7HJU8_PORTR|nr:hypothetical protein [Portunus trituberculatus]